MEARIILRERKHKMKTLKSAMIAAFITLAVASGYADQTNLVQNLRIQLYGYTQGDTYTNASFIITPANPVMVGTRRVIQALAAVTANTFSPTSSLVIITPLAGGAPSFQVRDGGNIVDVTPYLVNQASDSVHSSALNRRSGRSFTIDYSIQRFILQDIEGSPVDLHFDVTGFAIRNSMYPGGNVEISVAGTGYRNGKLVLFQGTIELRGRTLEVVPDTGGVT
jgi:hypothetical protein